MNDETTTIKDRIRHFKGRAEWCRRNVVVLSTLSLAFLPIVLALPSPFNSYALVGQISALIISLLFLIAMGRNIRRAIYWMRQDIDLLSKKDVK